MTNSIVKRLIKRGLLAVKKLNNRNMKYIVTPEGMKTIAKRSYQYFKRTIKNVVNCKEAIDVLLSNVKQHGYDSVVLLGMSDLEFIVEHFCLKYKLKLFFSEINELNSFIKDNIFIIFAESDNPESILDNYKELLFNRSGNNTFNHKFLRDII